MKISFYVIDQNLQPILGARTCIQYDLVTINEFDQINQLTKQDILDQYEDVLNGLGKIGRKCKIEVDEKVKPVIHANRKIPLAYYE